MSDTCQVYLYPNPAVCNRPAVAHHELMCVHEHIESFDACAYHDDLPYLVCTPCYEAGCESCVLS